jgi:hypothetical protein
VKSFFTLGFIKDLESLGRLGLLALQFPLQLELQRQVRPACQAQLLLVQLLRLGLAFQLLELHLLALARLLRLVLLVQPDRRLALPELLQRQALLLACLLPYLVPALQALLRRQQVLVLV